MEDESELINEVDCLRAIFSPEEMEDLYLGHDRALLKFKVFSYNSNLEKFPETEVTFDISSSYPQVIPTISLNSSGLQNCERKQVENEVRKFASTLCGNPMIMDIVIWINNYLSKHYSSKMSNNEVIKADTDTEDEYFSLVLIDHMRSKGKYIKILKSWAAELNVCGRLIFCKHWIFLILKGSKKNVKFFITRQKTVCIDVDSSGRSCKEKMLKILHEGPYSITMSSFSVLELNSTQELELFFTEASLKEIYGKFIKCIVK